MPAQATLASSTRYSLLQNARALAQLLQDRLRVSEVGFRV